MRLLDLFCGVGGAAIGYHLAGFEVTGIDIKPQPRYPFLFIQSDALDYVSEHGHEYDVIHASPPCQGYSRTRHLPWLKGKNHPMLIPKVRELLIEIGKPYIIENVGDAPLMGIRLRGGHFGLPFRRERIFETSEFILYPDADREPIGTSGRMFGNRLRKQHEQLGIDSQAIPPEYTEWIGRQILDRLIERQRETESGV